jgi:adenosylcobyric acid synthase
VSANGLVVGTYMHGLFANDAWRQAYFASFGKQLDSHVFDDVIEQGLNDLADHLAVHMDMTEFSRIAGL